MDLEKLKLLETRIETILDQHRKLAEERDRLSRQVTEAETRLEAVTARLQEFEQERTEIKTRVERILGRIDGVDVGQ